MQEKTVSEKEIFLGKLLKFKIVSVRLPNGKTTTREIVCHPGAVAIVPMLSKDKVILVKQYRKPAEKTLLEIPAGTLEPKETPLRCAQRELIEETGYRACNIKKILEFYPSPGYCTEKIHIFKAVNLKKIKPQNEPDEFIKTVVATKSNLKKLFARGKIKDSKTLIALYYLGLV